MNSVNLKLPRADCAAVGHFSHAGSPLRMERGRRNGVGLNEPPCSPLGTATPHREGCGLKPHHERCGTVCPITNALLSNCSNCALQSPQQVRKL